MTDQPDLSGSHPETLGYCPHCAVPVPAELLLIEYERAHGRACYAECPACGDVVRPSGPSNAVGSV